MSQAIRLSEDLPMGSVSEHCCKTESEDIAGDQRMIDTTEGTWRLDEFEGKYKFEGQELKASVERLEGGDTEMKVVGRFYCDHIGNEKLELPQDTGPYPSLTSSVLEIVQSEIMTEIQNPANDGALFVLPSQLNGAEYPSHSTVVRNVADYKYDNTGGPRGQLAVHPAAAQFVLDNAAHTGRAGGINAVDTLLEKMKGCGLMLQNGYLKIGNAGTREDEIKTTLAEELHNLRLLAMEDIPACGLQPSKREFARGLAPTEEAPHHVGLVYASAVPVDSYMNRGLSDPKYQADIAELILIAQYYGALKHAAIVAAEKGMKRKVYLMPLGGGVFNNPWKIIARSMARALEMLAKTDMLKMLEIKALAWKGNPAEWRTLTEQFMTLNKDYCDD